MRVAVRIEEALFSRHQPPSTIDADRATLEYESGFNHVGGEHFGERGAGRLIAAPSLELPAPGVESKMHSEASLRTADYERGAVVAYPRIVERDLDHLHPVADRSTRLDRVRGCCRHNGHRLESRH